MSYLNTQFYSFLKKYKVYGNAECTHVAVGSPYGKYFIPDNKLNIFLYIYSKLLIECHFENREPNLHIAEKQNSIGPVIIDIDIKQNDPNRVYLVDNIEKTVAIFNGIIKKYIDIPETNIEAFVFERNDPYYDDKKKIYKDGIHIIYPYVFIDNYVKDLIFNEAVDQIISTVVFSTSIECEFDKYATKVPWLMYGSSKLDKKPYNLTMIYNHEVIPTNCDKYFIDELVKILSLRKKKTEYLLKPEFKHNNGNNNGNNGNNNGNNNNKNNLGQSYKDDIYSDIDINDNINTAKLLTSRLSEKRSQNYHEWLSVGWVLRGIDDSLYDTYIEFSKKCPQKFDENRCEKIWNSYNPTYGDKYTIASLYYWVTQDEQIIK